MTLTAIIIVIAIVLLAVTLHEAMHAFAGYWLGDDTAQLSGRLTLNPLAHIDPVGTVLIPGLLIMANVLGVPTPIFGAAKPVPFNPMRVRFGDLGAALVALAGPLTNLLMALLVGFGYRFSGLAGGSEGIDAIVSLFVSTNLAFFVFNMIPMPPLDGSRVLYAFSPRGLREIMTKIESYGLIGVIILIFFFSEPLTSFIRSSVLFLQHLILG